MITHCISTYNTLPYLKLAVYSVRTYSHFKDAPFVVHAENCTDGTNEWLEENKEKYNLEVYTQQNEVPLGIGGGMNFCADKVTTEFINFLHSDFFVSQNWDLELLKVFEKYPNEKLWVNSHRVEPNVFNMQGQRPGTLIVPTDLFGELHSNFDEAYFIPWANEFTSTNDFELPKGEGVSGLIRKVDWDAVGGNDARFAPTSWDDIDLFLRMRQYGIRFVLPSKSLVYHFAARSSHFMGDNFDKKLSRNIESEPRNVARFIEKWGGLPKYDLHGMPVDIIINTP